MDCDSALLRTSNLNVPKKSLIGMKLVWVYETIRLRNKYIQARSLEDCGTKMSFGGGGCNFHAVFDQYQKMGFHPTSPFVQASSSSPETRVFCRYFRVSLSYLKSFHHKRI